MIGEWSVKANLFLHVFAFKCQSRRYHSQCDKVLVAHKLGSGEGAEGVEEEGRGLFEITDGHEIHSLIHLQTISPIPVSTRVYQSRKEVNEQRELGKWMGKKSEGGEKEPTLWF